MANKKMGQSQTLSIRIKFAEKKPSVSKQETVYSYHWPRIISVIILLAALVTAIIVTLFTNENKQPKLAQPLLSTAPLALTNIKNTNITSPKIEKTVSPPPFTQSKQQVFSPHIKDFVIAKRVRDKKPVGTISDIKFDHNNVATVYAYSRAMGLYKNTHYYIWSFNGKQVAKVKVFIGDNRWRSYSRKYITPNQRGDWQVKLVNKSGEVLAINNFRY